MTRAVGHRVFHRFLLSCDQRGQRSRRGIGSSFDRRISVPVSPGSQAVGVREDDERRHRNTVCTLLFRVHEHGAQGRGARVIPRPDNSSGGVRFPLLPPFRFRGLEPVHAFEVFLQGREAGQVRGGRRRRLRGTKRLRLPGVGALAVVEGVRVRGVEIDQACNSAGIPVRHRTHFRPANGMSRQDRLANRERVDHRHDVVAESVSQIVRG